MSKRISLLDGWRGLACLLMIVYHLLFDFYMFGWVGRSFIFGTPMVIFERFIAYSYILCAGISAHYTHSNLRRGLITAGAGVLVIIASFIVDAPILFGVLQFLSAAMILYALIGRWTEKVPEKIAPFLWLGLFILTKLWTENTLVQVKWLFWLGFKYSGFVSYDYFPILPYIFLFLLGAWLGRQLKKLQERSPDSPLLTAQAPRVLTWPGRHSLWIYLLHQPILYGACFVAYFLL